MKFEQVQSRDTRGIARYGNHIYACSALEGYNKHGIVKYDENFQTVDVLPLELDLHGLAAFNGELLAIDSENDILLHISPGLDVIGREVLTPHLGGVVRYHFNDIATAGKLRLVSSFGSWPPREGEGFITSDALVMITGIFHPHSPIFAMDHLFWCASASGAVMIATVNGDKSVRALARLPGYVRGLLPEPGEFFVGEGVSQDRMGGNPLKTARLCRFRFASYAADPAGLGFDCVDLPADNTYSVARV